MTVINEVFDGRQDTPNLRIASRDCLAFVSSHPAEVMIEALRRGEVAVSALELADLGFGFKTLVVAQVQDGRLGDHVVVLDGWTLVRAAGNNLNLEGVNLKGADLRGARLSGANLENADLRGANLEKANLSGSNLKGADFSGASLFSATLQSANLSEANFSRTNLRHADLRGTQCSRTAFRGADLWSTYMWDVDISKAFTDGADFARSNYLNKTAALGH